MGDNITREIYIRELNGVGKMDCLIASHMLEKLYYEEFMFDHSCLLRLHTFIKSLTVKNKNVRSAVINTIIKWCSDPDNIASHVFLVDYFKQFISDSDLQFIQILTDEIKASSH